MICRNYAANAVVGLLQSATRMEKAGYKHEAGVYFIVSSLIKLAQHFMLPDGGRLFEDNLRGLRSLEFRLPYEAITIEYWTPQDETPENKHLLAVHKRIALAFDLTKEGWTKTFTNFGRWPFLDDERGVFIIAIACLHDLWLLMPCAALVSSRWDADQSGKNVIPPLVTPPKHGVAVGVAPIIILPFVANKIIEEEGESKALQEMMHDLMDEMTATLELCEALSCINVTTSIIQQERKGLNARRISRGQVPFYETKILSLKVPLKSTHSLGGGTHSSPRQHLRRGHIRRLSNGNIWVNSHLVGSHGFISKRYSVTPLELSEIQA